MIERECGCTALFDNSGRLLRLEHCGACPQPLLQLGLALSASEPEATEATTTSNEDNYLGNYSDHELEERAGENICSG